MELSKEEQQLIVTLRQTAQALYAKEMALGSADNDAIFRLAQQHRQLEAEMGKAAGAAVTAHMRALAMPATPANVPGTSDGGFFVFVPPPEQPPSVAPREERRHIIPPSAPQ